MILGKSLNASAKLSAWDQDPSNTVKLQKECLWASRQEGSMCLLGNHIWMGFSVWEGLQQWGVVLVCMIWSPPALQTAALGCSLHLSQIASCTEQPVLPSLLNFLSMWSHHTLLPQTISLWEFTHRDTKHPLEGIPLCCSSSYTHLLLTEKQHPHFSSGSKHINTPQTETFRMYITLTLS